ncbi:elongation factor 2 [Aeropyrum pernix K1]|uniref:Elongation factor 2 n=1 Tax=Aeropyrum pernix (strain ATCC 700893 / DSM 11879 / JCM 9820 / NBRC 100138 / K1) TaxID=272557 RepID=EF2_AERPE|nr:elongation factor EF-2 [Aeropyrum pernix]Q9YC19.1 RecName: Full=Elongation factor 2; Short=EF-2 [Aeropyrum pernix K1]BAA80429.1 elongation factor 2 [Aeropyrum pernix K1]
MGARVKVVSEIEKIMRNIDQIRNIGIIAHVDHGKTTTSDSLLAAAGIISERIAGEALVLDYLNVEKQRGITVKSANVSLYHEYEGKPYVINLIDTPGHVDFSGKVTRSLRVLDGAIVVVDAVEGVMTQTETVIRQALEERVRPILFINKVDRLIKELKLPPEKIQQRFVEIIKEVNNLIDLYAEPEFRKKWKLDPNAGMVAFGSAKDKWGISVPQVKKKGITFREIIQAYEKGKEAVAELSKKMPLHETLLDMVIKFVPNPREAQRYRIPKIWKGDINSEIGQAMLNADPDGPLVFFINDVRIEKAGLVATGRVFSGTLRSGEEVYLLNAGKKSRLLQVSIYMGPFREVTKEIPAGNIGAVMGFEDVRAGETVVSLGYEENAAPFESLRYVSEPVVTIAVEPVKIQDLPKMIEALRKLTIEDPNLVVKINEETGEYLLSGMGPLHLEIALTMLREKFGVEVKASPPIVVYRETVRQQSRVFEGKSPNKHNKLYISVEPLNEETITLIQNGAVTEDQDPKDRARILADKAGWDYNEARKIWAIDENINVFVDKTAGVQYLREVKDTIIAGFRLALKEGPLAAEPVRGVKVVLHDAVIHEDPVHRGPGQLYPAVRNAIWAGILDGRPTLLEPLQKLDIRAPMEYLSNITAVLTRKRGRIINVETTGVMARIIAAIPVAESFDLAGELRSATAGRAFWGVEFYGWAPVPDQMLQDLIAKIRQRKGLPPSPPKIDDLIGP